MARQMTGEATFSLYVRHLPPQRNFLLACGLGEVLRYLENLRFSSECLSYLASQGGFDAEFLRQLAGFRFTGNVYAVSEGTPIFANEPILEVVAPLPEAQLVETYVMNQVHLATLLASKAARVVLAAEGRGVVDFGARRMHGTDAAIKAARAFSIAGLDATSNVLAGKIYGLPVTGTMAHSFVQAFDDELDAFRTFARIYPETILLVDTYDTLEGVRRVVALARELGADFKVSGVRLDSGNMVALAVEARRILDAGGLSRVRIFASGGLDEHEIARIVAEGAPIDGFGVGTALGVSRDAPGLDIAYKLCAYEGRGRLKLSAGKPILPGRKQVFRRGPGEGVGDVIARAGEDLPGRPLLQPVMRNGRRLAAEEPIAVIRDRTRAELAVLPAAMRGLAPACPAYPVEVSPALAAYQQAVTRVVAGGAAAASKTS
jgi:nicotinate phosphoribosyltransferase